jgi:hypothetical protein
MKVVTKKFIELRSDCALVDVVKIKQRGAKPNNCFFNSLKLSSKDKKYRLQSGWLVGDDFGNFGTMFIAHYWVIDTTTNIEYDPTPKNLNDYQIYEYIYDPLIFKKSTPKNYMPFPLRLLPNNQFQIAVGNEVYKDITSIDLDELFKFKLNYL